MLISSNRRNRSSRILCPLACMCLALLVAFGHVRAEAPTADVQPAMSPRIPEDSIARLQKTLADTYEMESSTEKRRACKNVVRRAEKLLEEYPSSPNRFGVLGIIFEGRKVLFTMSSSEAYREALLQTAKKLVEAPDEYADIRLEADVVLQQVELARGKSTPKDRAMAMAELADRYRDTPAEAESLMIASMITFDTGHVPLLDAFRQTLSTRFGQDPNVSAFLREKFAVTAPVRFGGTFQRADGKSVCLQPGQIYVACFWSKEAPLLDRKVAEVRDVQARHKGQFEVFSFNLDELPDGGAGALKSMGLDWTAVLLPGGTDNPTYLSVGGTQLFTTLVVDAYGWASADRIGRPATALSRKYEAIVESPRLLALMRSFSIGEFLITDPFGPADFNSLPELKTYSRDTGQYKAAMLKRTTKSVPLDTLGGIQACFVVPPMRYRLSRDDALKNYQKADRLCREAIAHHADAPDLWIVHNRRIIALLGIWRLSGDADYLGQAVASARASLAMDLPLGAGTVPHFCLATRSLRRSVGEPEQVLATFIEAAGGGNAPGAAVAAALMLSLDAHSGDLYAKYRDLLLGEYVEDPSTWWVGSFLLDPSCSAHLFERALPGRKSAIKTSQEVRRILRVNWTTVDGQKIELPRNGHDKINAIVFMSPTRDRNASTLQKRVMDHLTRTAAGRTRKDIDVVCVYLCKDEAAAAALKKRKNWPFKAVCLPETKWRPLTRQTGIFSPDLRPNVYLVRPDGSVLLALSGVSLDSERIDKLTNRIDAALRDYDLRLADKALAEGDIQEYAARLATSFPPKNLRLRRYAPRYPVPNAHRRKLVWAYMQLKEWRSALDAANKNISAHEESAIRAKRVCGTCARQVVPLLHRANILKQLGRTAEAKAARELADAALCPPGCKLEPRSMFPGRRMMAIRDLNARLAFVEDSMKYAIASRPDHFDLAGDLLMRAETLEQLGQKKKAAGDRKRAEALAWPYPPQKPDARLSLAACDYRRKLARDHIRLKQWQKALEKTDTNINAHEASARAMGRHCPVCATQIVPLQYRLGTLKQLGKTAEAEDTAAMIKAATCPPGCEARPVASFPLRYFRTRKPPERLKYVEDHMRRNGGGKKNVQGRFDLAADLLLRAEALENLGRPDDAARDRARARALVWPFDAKTGSSLDTLPARYVEVVDVDGDDQ